MILFLTGFFGLSAVFAEILDLRNGDNCTTLGGGFGTCRLLSKCNTVGDFKSYNPPKCLFNGTDLEPIVCCPLKEEGPVVEVGRKVQAVCSELGNVCRGITDPKETIKLKSFEPPINGKCTSGPWYGIVGGTEVAPRSHPYMALIGYCGTEKRGCNIAEVMWACGGSLITPRYVLSAAHCAYPFSLGTAKWARLGDLDNTTSSDDAKPVDKRIVEINVHPKYSKSQVYHDIALFKLDSKVVFNGYILPVCLHTQRDIFETKAKFTGWGRTGAAKGTSDKLLEAEVDIYNETECRRLMFDTLTPMTPLGLQPDLMLCAGVPDGSKDTCTGDSGGPLVIGNDFRCAKTQIGITSYGKSCGLPDSPGVYTRISNYIPWIEDVAFRDLILCNKI